MNRAVVMLLALTIGGCARLDFGEEGLLYYEPVPYVLVSVDKTCVATATVISLPGEPKHVKFESGFGSAELSVELSNGMLTKVGQTTDTKIPEAIAAVAALRAAEDKGFVGPECPSVTLYPIRNGKPDRSDPVKLFP